MGRFPQFQTREIRQSTSPSRGARRFKGKMQSEDARVENHPVVRQVYRVGKVATPRGMIRFALGSLEVCEITDEITAGILGAEVTGNSATWLTELKKKFPCRKWQTYFLSWCDPTCVSPFYSQRHSSPFHFNSRDIPMVPLALE